MALKKCPKCGQLSKHDFVKSWKIGMGRGIVVELWRCRNCEKTWRRYIK
ncbi:MAG: hypothetical protein OEZ25_06745 [Candidatus Bathyarchaeota archaeon]|nr:hypothetical protein [Candidatus Bathyarchaeota archaeon]